ncbi:MAG: DUF1592 domain-containing protein [Myxococcaceae bacterium]|nr:DUF1592 domain-containing protein [Myxococcaceae bacterium]
MRRGWLVGVTLLLGCEGSIVGLRPPVAIDPTDPTVPSTPTGGGAATPRPEGRLALQPIRRLSIAQYENTLRTLFPGPLGAELVSRARYPGASTRTGLTSGFTSDADTNTVSSSDANAIEDSAEALAEYLLANARTAMPALFPCQLPSGFTDAAVDGCIGDFISTFGRRAYRRPLRAAEQTALRQAYTTVRMTQPAPEAWSAVMQAFLQAPALLYRAEAGDGASGIVQLSPHELASRLAFLITDAPPDAELLARAEDGTLSQPEVLEAQATRLLARPEASAVVSRFIVEWLRIDLLDGLPDNDPTLPAPLREEYLAQADRLVRNTLSPTSGSVRDLFRTTQVPLGPQTDDLYGQPGRGSASFPAVSLPERVGILASAPFLKAHAPAGHQNAIIRGAFVRKHVLCKSLPTLPGNVDLVAPLDGSRNAPTARQRLAPTMTLPACSGCHVSFNPIGYALETFDGMGRHRTTENGAPIDPSGTVELDDTTRWTFTTTGQFLDTLAGSDDLVTCMAKEWFHFAHGRQSAIEEQPFVDALSDSAKTSGGTMRELVLGVVRSPRFTQFLREAP